MVNEEILTKMENFTNWEILTEILKFSKNNFKILQKKIPNSQNFDLKFPQNLIFSQKILKFSENSEALEIFFLRISGYCENFKTL